MHPLSPSTNPQRKPSAPSPTYLASLCEHQLCPQCAQQHPALNAHGVWHSEHQLVALGSGNKRKTNTRVATRRLNLGGGRDSMVVGFANEANR